MSTHNLCFEQKYENIIFSPENFHFLVGKPSVYLNRRIFVMLLSGEGHIRRGIL